jgi:hypothetical protein
MYARIATAAGHMNDGQGTISFADLSTTLIPQNLHLML